MDQQYEGSEQSNAIPPPPLGVPPYEPQSGVPSWDYVQEIGFLRALFSTIKEVLFNPIDTFRRMSPTGNLGKAFLYVLMLSTVAAVVGIVFQTMIQFAFLMLTSAFTHTPLRAMAIALAGGVFNIIFVLIGSLIGTCISIPLQSAIIHLALMVFVRIRQPFESTFRIVCYSSGSTGVLQMVPFLGWIVALVWNIVNTIIGIKEQNRIPTITAVLVVLVPMVLMLTCCCVAILGGIGLIIASTGMNIDQILKQIHF